VAVVDCHTVRMAVAAGLAWYCRPHRQYHVTPGRASDLARAVAYWRALDMARDARACVPGEGGAATRWCTY